MLLGANLGDVEMTFARARALIEQRVGQICGASSVMWSEAWGFEADSRFGNQALIIETSLQAEELLDRLQAIEAECGRDRAEEQRLKRESGERYCSRMLDADIIFFGSEVIDSERLSVPHPLLPEREFALAPIAELMPTFCHPESGETIAEMLNKLRENI